MYKFAHNLLVVSCLFLLCQCGGGAKKNNRSTTTQAKAVLALKTCPNFEGDSAYAFVKAQVDFGPRVPNSEAHKLAGEYLYKKLAEFGFDANDQEFEAEAYNGDILNSRNIIGVLNPEASKRILLSAHWDSRPYNDKEVEDSTEFVPIDGANDGASGVGVLLEIARAISLAEEKPKIGIDIIFFDSEDYGQPENSQNYGVQDDWCLGSQYWGENPHTPNYSAYYGILLDMVGAKEAQFYQEGNSRRFAPKINKQVWDIAHALGYKSYFINSPSPAITDDHVYVNKFTRIPIIDIVDYNPEGNRFFPDYHHTLKDNIELIDKNTLKAVGQTVLQVLYNEEPSI